MEKLRSIIKLASIFGAGNNDTGMITNPDPNTFMGPQQPASTFMGPQEPSIDNNYIRNDVNSVNDLSIGNDPTTLDAVAKLFKPQHSASDQLQNQLNNVPLREDYAPSKKDKVLANIFSLGGVNRDIYHRIADDKYNTALTDWDIKTKPLAKLADDENRDNTNNATAWNNNRARDIAQENVDRQERRDRETKDTADKRIEIQARREKAYTYRTLNPNHVIKQDENGFLIGISPTNDKAAYVLDSDGQRIKSSVLSDYDKAAIKFNDSSALISQRAAESRRTNQEASDNIEEREKRLVPIRGEEARRTKETIPGKAAGQAGNSNSRTMSPAQKSIETFMRAQEAYNTHPEWRPYIKMDRGGKQFKIEAPAGKPATLFRNAEPGGDDNISKEISKFIYGSDNKSASPTSSNKPERREIPGKPGKFAILKDGKWIVE